LGVKNYDYKPLTDDDLRDAAQKAFCSKNATQRKNNILVRHHYRMIMKFKYSYCCFFSLLILYGCNSDKLTFSENEVASFIINSKILEKNIDSFIKIKTKYGYPLISKKERLDSLIGENNFTFLNKIKAFRVENDNVNYHLLSIQQKKYFIEPVKHIHWIIYNFENQAKKNVDVNAFLTDNEKVNPKWVEAWGVWEIVYWEKLDKNLYYIVIEETLL